MHSFRLHFLGIINCSSHEFIPQICQASDQDNYDVISQVLFLRIINVRSILIYKIWYLMISKMMVVLGFH